MSDKGEIYKEAVGVSAIGIDGILRFSSVQNSIFPTKYALELDVPNGYQIKGNEDKGTVRTKFENLETFQKSKTILLETGSTLTGSFWVDFNLNGRQDENEYGANSLEVLLISANGQIVSKSKSNSKGIYVFSKVPSGKFFLGINQSSVSRGFSVGGIGNKTILRGVSGRTDIMIQVLGNGDQQIRNLALVPESSVDGKLYAPKEFKSPNLVEVVVISGSGIDLLKEDVPIGTTKSSVDGKFVFSNIKPGKYEVIAENDRFIEKKSVYLVPGETQLSFNDESADLKAINLSVQSGDSAELSVSSDFHEKVNIFMVLASATSVAGILIVLAKRRKLIYRSK